MTEDKGIHAVNTGDHHKQEDRRTQGTSAYIRQLCLDKKSNRTDNGSLRAESLAPSDDFPWGSQQMELVNIFIQYLLLFQTPYEAPRDRLRTPKLKRSLQTIVLKFHFMKL